MNYALKNGGRDNISIILIEYKKSYKEILLTIFVVAVLVIVILILKGAII